MADQEQQDSGRSARPRLHRGDTLMTARRVAAAKYDLDLIKRDVCQWLSETLQLDITPDTFLDMLDTGVVLCSLVVLVQEKARAIDISEEDKSKLKVKIPLEPIKYHSGAKKATFHARENTKYFLDWCRGLGIRDDLIFETNGLVEHSDEKRVMLCLLEVSRYARRVNIKPPDIVTKEQEAIEEAEAMAGPVVEEAIEKAEAMAGSEVEGAIEKADVTAEPVVEEDTENGDTIRSDEQESDDVTTPKHSAEPVELIGQSLVPSEQAVIHDESGHRFGSIPRFLDHCSYPIFFSLLLLVLLLGGGMYLRKRR